MSSETTTVDLLVHSVRWVGDTHYRTRMLGIPFPPHTWRLVCRDPDGGFQVVACVSFMANGGSRTMRARLRDVKR